MKKLVVAFSLLFTIPAFAKQCSFNLTFNDQWNNFRNWIIIITDISDAKIHEVVGGPLVYYGEFPKSGQLSFTMDNCNKNTQIGLFAHAPGQKVLTDTNGGTIDQGFKAQAFAPFNFLEGMAKCMGDINPTNWNNIALEVGNPNRPGDFMFTSKSTSQEQDSWTKTQLGAVCKHVEGESD